MYDLVKLVRENPAPELIQHYVPQSDECPHCGEHRRPGFNHVKYRPIKVNDNMQIKFRRVEGKTVVLLGKKICTDKCLEKELTKMIEKDSPEILAVVKKIAVDSDFDNGTAFKLGDGYRNSTVVFWDKKNQKVIPADSDLNGGYGGVPINFLIGDGDFTPSEWEDDLLGGVVESYPNMRLILEMKTKAENNINNGNNNSDRKKKNISVLINEKRFTIKYNPEAMKGKWESCTLMLRNGDLIAEPGSRAKRNTIKTADAAALKEAETYVEAKLRSEEKNATTAYVPNTPEEAAAKALEKKAVLEKYGQNLKKLHTMPEFSGARIRAQTQASKNVTSSLMAIGMRKTVKAVANKSGNNNGGLNRLAKMKELKALHKPNSPEYTALVAEEMALIQKHLGGKRKTRRGHYF